MPRPFRPLLAVAALTIGLSPALAQRTELDQLTRPTTVPGYWAAIKAEIGLGKFDTAADYLKGLLALNPTEKDLLAIEEKEGIAAFLDLNNVPRWSGNETVNKEAKDNVAKLINQVTAAVKKLRADPDRIQKYIRNLTATPEERDYAFLELKKSGAAVMPQLVGSIQNADLQERAALIGILPRLDPETVPALLAAMDINNPTVRVEFLNVLQARRDILDLMGRTLTDPRPTLWHLSTGNDLVASKAKLLLASLTSTPLTRLPLPAAELTRAAEDMYQHRNTLAKENGITLWRWDGRQLTSAPATPSQAEEYLGLRYARWALEREPNYEPATVTFLSLATEKAFERGGLEARLSKSSPAIHELLAVAPASVLYAMLDRALAENHLLVALGAAQVIGERAETHGKSGAEPLVRALNSADRRVALAAADALIRLPGTAGSQASVRIVEVYRAALAAAPGGAGASLRPKALIADPNEFRAKMTADVVERAGYDSVITRTGRDTLRRLNLASDVDVLWVSHELPYPMLPEFLAQVRGDYRYGKLPMFVTVAPDLSKVRINDIDLMLEQLEDHTRDWLYPQDVIDAATRLVERAQDGARGEARDRHRLILDRSRHPVRVDLIYDALRLTTAEDAYLRDWRATLAKEHPKVRQTSWARQRIFLSLSKDYPLIEPSYRALTVGLREATMRRLSETLTVVDLPGDALPELLAARLGDLLRDYAYETREGVRARLLTVTRQIPTTVSLTSVNVPIPQPPTGAEALFSGNPPPGASPDAQPEAGYSPAIEEDKIRRAVPELVEARLKNLLANYKNVKLIAEPLNPAEVAGAMRFMQFTAGPTLAPLSEAERKDQQRRAIDALRQMATGALAGYDVRPATREILEAIRSDELAPAAIEAAGRLPGKEAQAVLAEAVLNVARPASIRRLATEELVRNLQKFGPTSITDAQVADLVRLLDEEKNPEVKAGISLVLGTLPRERVVKQFADPKARDAWLNRLLNYQPQPAAPAPPAKPEGT